MVLFSGLPLSDARLLPEISILFMAGFESAHKPLPLSVLFWLLWKHFQIASCIVSSITLYADCERLLVKPAFLKNAVGMSQARTALLFILAMCYMRVAAKWAPLCTGGTGQWARAINEQHIFDARCTKLRSWGF